jgi:protein phosphatase
LGNHEEKLLRKLRGRNVQVTHGLEMTLQELDTLPEAVRQPFRQEIEGFLGSLPSHYVLDRGSLVVAHAGIKKSMIGREAPQVREFTLYGETTGEIDAYGLPVRANWSARYHGKALIVYGHTAVKKPDWLNHTLNIDTGCVFGGRLTAFRYPEKSLLSVQAARVYSAPKKPLEDSADALLRRDASERESETIPEDAEY